MEINSYSFGSITVNGRQYTKDIIILPGQVVGNWWRKEGHQLSIEDLSLILEEDKHIGVLVIGTGYSGMMNVPNNVRDFLQEIGLRVIVQPTRQACQTFNELARQDVNVAAALHLTC
ncbi:MAG: Mth938-like domain-containing protein [Candidatus Ranarchaeia archaeon]